ncbi:MAG: acyl-CoA thioesterase [Christensenellaceae bacterium]
MSKKIQESYSEATHIVMAGDTNQMGNLHGGTLMQWVDIIGAVCASRHANRDVTTAALDSMDFKISIPIGYIVTLRASVTWTGNTSLEVRVDVYSEQPHAQKKIRTNTAYLVFVAIDAHKKPIKVPSIIIETQEEKEEYERAIARKQNRLSRKSENRIFK